MIRHYVVRSALAGIVWGLLALFLAGDLFGRLIWVGVLGSPIIGVFAGLASEPFRSKSAVVRIVVSLVLLYLAVVMFGVLVGAADVLSGSSGRLIMEVVVQSILAVLWGVTFTGYVLFLWPLAYLTQWWVHCPPVADAGSNSRKEKK